jgi:hypothetical protein
MKKTAIFLILFICQAVFSQRAEEKITRLTFFADSVTKLIENSTGGPGEVFSAVITMQRNLRAIGMQNTKITFYYFQAEDSAYEGSNGMEFIPKTAPPLKILVEYNIASSQQVKAEYFINGSDLFYRFASTGAYGNSEKQMWFGENDMVKYTEVNSGSEKSIVREQQKFSKQEYNESLLVLDRLKEYTKLYYNLFKAEQLDK